MIQALRYHFVSRKEIKTMMIAVNIFAIISAVLFFFKKISPVAFLISSILWFGLMTTFWFILPRIVYKRSKTFLDSFRAILEEDTFTIENERGSKTWNWSEFAYMMESPHFFHLYFDNRSFFLIPKEAFEGDLEYEASKKFRSKIKGQ